MDWLKNSGVTATAVVGWTLAAASLCWNVHQARRQRRTKVNVSVKCERVYMPGREHERALLINVVNDGTELNDVNVTLSYPQADGKSFTVHLSRQNIPNPFKFGYSCEWSYF